jgi:hypothetical protein
MAGGLANPYRNAYATEAELERKLKRIPGKKNPDAAESSVMEWPGLPVAPPRLIGRGTGRQARQL